MAKFRPRRRKDLRPTKGRLISCGILLTGVLVLFFMLFAAVLRQ